MMTLSYDVGQWHAEAKVEELAAGKLMAVISLTGESSGRGSRHTVVFDQRSGCDKLGSTEMLVRRLLQKRHGVSN